MGYSLMFIVLIVTEGGKLLGLKLSSSKLKIVAFYDFLYVCKVIIDKMIIKRDGGKQMKWSELRKQYPN
jgi:hypothetical protein